MRLIDADKCPCKECMSEFHCNNTYCAEFEEWLQKPVYDIDKVVEDLKSHAKYALQIDESINDYQIINECIEIVKLGAKRGDRVNE